MRATNFYYGTTKTLISIFGKLFSDMKITSGDGREINVPIHYSQKSKFIEILSQQADPQNLQQDVAMPVMGYELTGLEFAPDRNTNPLSRMSNIAPNSDNTKSFQYNRVPYDVHFNLYIAVNRSEDGMRIIEQILPFFAPEFTITINDPALLNTNTNITTVLNSTSWDYVYEGTFDDLRVITWELNFTMHAFMYSNTQRENYIKNMFTTFSADDFNSSFVQLMSQFDGTGQGNIRTSETDGPIG